MRLGLFGSITGYSFGSTRFARADQVICGAIYRAIWWNEAPEYRIVEADYFERYLAEYL